MQQTISITVTGKVQGVNFRASTKYKAQELGITGEVRNLPNGNVHIIATGNEIQLQEFKEWCKLGPRLAEVSDIIIVPEPVQSFPDFAIVRG